MKASFLIVPSAVTDILLCCWAAAFVLATDTSDNMNLAAGDAMMVGPASMTSPGALRDGRNIRRLHSQNHHDRIVAEEEESEKTCPTKPISSCMELEYTYGMNHGECQCSERHGEGIFECRQNNGSKHGVVWCQGQLSKTQAFLIGSKNKGGSTASLSRTVPSPPTPKIQQGDYITESVSEKTVEEKIYSMGIGNIVIAVGAIAIMGVVLIVVMVVRSRRQQKKQQQRQLHAIHDTMSLDSDGNSLEEDDDSYERGVDIDENRRKESRSSNKIVEMATLS